jgi:hypothetical protein
MSTSGFGAYALSGESVVVVVGNYEFAAGFTRKAAPSACTKSSHYPRRSQDTPGENDMTRQVYGVAARGINANRGPSPVPFRTLVPGAGIEPASPCGGGILSPLRLPVSPPGRGCSDLPVASAGGANRSMRGPRSMEREAVAAATKNPPSAGSSWGVQCIAQWRPRSESNRRTRICSPLHDHSATWPLRNCFLKNKTPVNRGFAKLERETRLELATPTLARSCSTN